MIASPALPMPDFNPHSLTGATFSSNASSTSSAFQSTLPYGSDLEVLFLKPCPPISIHAPLRERPIILFLLANVERDFNPRSLTGATPKAGYTVLVLKRFQSTLPHGSDFKIFKPRNGMIAFQSTLPHGSDLTPLIVTKPNLNFNPRSLTGATNDAAQKGDTDNDFNPRSLAGATHASYFQGLLYVFQSTLPRGSDACRVDLFITIEISIHAPSRERQI